MDGDLTLGENIADNGGLREAFVAYQIYKEMFGQEKNLPGFENYTSDQLFFMSFGNVRKSLYLNIHTYNIGVKTGIRIDLS